MMQGVCEHSLYICRCSSPSSLPSDSFDRRRSPRIPVYVSQTSVAVMTSPTLGHPTTMPLRHACRRAEEPSVSYYGEIIPSASSGSLPGGPISLRLPTTAVIEAERRRSCMEKTVFLLLLSALLVVGFIACLVSFLHFGGGSLNSHWEPPVTDHSPTSSSSSNQVSSHHEGHNKAHSSRGDRHHHHTTKRVCISDECSDLSRSMMSNIDENADPCHSFYQFACGGWMAQNAPPPRRLVHSVMSKQRDAVDLQLRDFVLSVDANTGDHADKQLRLFYDSCMDTTSIRAKGYVPAVQLIHDEYAEYFKDKGKTDDRGSEKNRLTELILRLIRSNGTPVFDISLDLSPKNSSRFIGVIKVPARSGLLPKLTRSSRGVSSFLYRWVRHRKKRNSRGGYKYVSRKEIFKSFENALNTQRVAALVKTAEKLGILQHSSSQVVQRDIDEILGFLAALEKALPTEKEMKENLMKNRIYNEYNIEQLERSFRYVNWTSLMTGLFGALPSKDTIFLVHNPTYLRKLGRIISLFDSRIVWKSLLILFARDMLSDLVTIHHGLPRWQYCTQISSMLFGEVISRLYMQSVPKDRRDEELKQVQSIFHLIKGKILRKLNEITWLDSKTLILTKDKINRVQASFYGSNIFLNRTFVDGRYMDVEMGYDFFHNVLSMYRHFRNSIYHFISSDVDKQIYIWSLISYPFTVNAFHLQQLNSLVIPSGILQEIHFRRNIPMYLNLGSLGLTLSHEIFHSLDDMGRSFNSQGVYDNWWSPNAEKALNNVSHCIKRQYMEHFRRPLKIDTRSILIEVDGVFTLSENICDVDGMNIVSDVLKDMSKNNFRDVVHLPNNPYPPIQLFFINIAQAYCSHVGPVSYVLYLELDEHSPNPERVDGFMMNTELFSKAFKCPSGTRMNPKRKCRVWT